MKFKITINYDCILDKTNIYNQLIEDGYLPDEAKRYIRQSLKEDYIDRLDVRADNLFWTDYSSYYKIEEIEDD